MSKRVVVVGGGIAGLAAFRQLQLQQPDIEVVLLEASPHLGGKIKTTNFLGQPIFNLNENLTEAAIKLSKTLLESPIQHIFNFEIGFFFISSTVNTSDNT